MPYMFVCRMCGHVHVEKTKQAILYYAQAHLMGIHGVYAYPSTVNGSRSFKLYGPGHKVAGAIHWIKDKTILKLWENPESRKLLVQTWLRNKLIRVFNR